MPVGPLFQLKQDINGAIETRVLAFDFVNDLATGDTLTGSPTIEQASETTGAVLLTITGVVIFGTQVQVRVGLTGTLYAIYDVSCTAQTTGGDTLVSSCGIEIVPSK